ncbi:MAG: MBL fold metallo-hydrolase [Clostridia bacterium]|nr:MBL fold metallo-hydrolase [Clostridia bacterium]
MRTLTFCLGALRTNTYFCFDENRNTVVIDPGMDGEGIYEKLVQKELSPQYILLTHGHFDHSQGVRILAEKTGAKVCVHSADAVMLHDPGKNSSGFYYRGDTTFYPRTEADILLEDGDEIRCGSMRFSVIHTPGHTPGSVCFREENTLFCGDTVFAYGYGRYDLWGGDRESLSASLDRIAAMDDGIKLCPGHGNTASLDRIRADIFNFATDLR